MDLREAFLMIRPWSLKAASVLRIGALLVSMPLLIHGGKVAILIALWLVGTALGIWRRKSWLWRLALLGDIAVVIGTAVNLMEVETSNLHLFGYIAAAAVTDVILLGVGQGALDPPVQLPP